MGSFARSAMLQVLHESISRLVGLQAGNESISDGVGFNNADLWLGKSMLLMWESYTKEDSNVAMVGHLLLKYKKTQLSEEEVRVAQNAASLDRRGYKEVRSEARGKIDALALKERERLLNTVYVDVSEQIPTVKFQYSPEGVAAVKECFEFRRYDGDAAVWRLTCRPTRAEWASFCERMHSLDREIVMLGGESMTFDGVRTPWPISASADTAKMSLRVWWSKDTPNFKDIVRACRVCEGRYNWDKSYWTIDANKAVQFAEIISEEDKWDVGLVQAEVAKLNSLLVSSLKKIRSQELQDLSVPDGIKLFQHQEKGIRFLMARDQALLADDMGLGKTLQALLAANQIGDAKRILILCPASLTHNWSAEIKKWMGESSSKILSSGAIAENEKYTIVSYDTAKRKGPTNQSVLSRTWDILICDEAHRMKNPSSKRHVVGKSVKAKRKWLLTGTPMLNRPMDLLGLLRIAKNPLGRNRHKFGVMYCAGYHNGWGWDYTGSSNLEDLAQKLSNWMLRRHKDEVLDLPGKTRMRSPVGASVAFDGNPGDIGNMMKMRHDMAVEKSKYTVDRARDIVDAGHKVVIFTEYIAVLDKVEKAMQRDGVRSVRIDGSKSQKDRISAVNLFQNDPSVMVFIGQTAAAGEGLTLTSASYVVFNDLSLVPAMHSQAEDRCYRIGQDKRVTVYYHVANRKLDYVLWSMLESKMATISNFESGLHPPAVALQDLLDQLRLCP